MATIAVLKPPKIVYPESDGHPMAESDLHRDLMFEVIAIMKGLFASKSDVYVSGNLLVYYEKGNIYKVLAPDCFVTFGVKQKRRKIYKVWDEKGIYPSVVFEITSKTTSREDLSTKLKIYQDIWKVKEYFLFDPQEEYLEPSLIGMRLVDGEYEPIPAVNGRVHSDLLHVTLERNGEWLRFRDVKTGREIERPDLVTAKEAEERAARAEAERDRLRQEIAQLRSQVEKSK